VGAYAKDEIRRLALEANFPNAQKPDSQDICFIPLGDYRAFLKERITPASGEIVDLAGNVLARHAGIEMFTVGQRRGLGLPGGEPRYVLRLEPETHRVVVGPESDLYRDQFWVSRVNYVAGTPPEAPLRVGVKIRYKFEEAEAVLRPAPGGAMIEFGQPQRAITPGQAAVFYQGDLVLGGGIIERDLPQ
jgi:tRNA-specific 2-thiouridylase